MYETFDYEMLEQLGAAFTAGDAIFQLGRFVLAIVAYVLRSIGLYAIAKRRGIPHAWMAWVPVIWIWVLGSISDQFRYVTKAQVKNKRTTLLVLKLIQTLSTTALLVILGVAFVELVNMGIVGAGEEEMMAEAMVLVFKFMGVGLLLGGIALATAIVRYIALYDLYISVNPANAVLFLILSIFFKVTEPFFVFFNRRRDTGMPPRCDVPQASVNIVPEMPAREIVPAMIETPVEESEATAEEPDAEETEVPAEEIVEEPATEEIEAPAEETVEEPAVEETEAPAEEVEEHAVEETEAPAEEAEEPAAEETEAPAEEVEEPVAEETEAPAEETEVPAEQTEA